MRGKIAIGLVAVIAVAALLYTAHTMDLIGMLLAMHSPPEGGH